MQYAALATDYDGTIAHDGAVDAATVAALERLRASQRRLILVTGRELGDLRRVLPRLDLFDRVVAENGALVHDPAVNEERLLAPAPPPAFVARLRELGVDPLSVGRVIVATWEPNEGKVLAAIRDLGLDLQIIFNKGAVMVLPGGVNKAAGLAAALAELGLSPLDCVGVGDAENDLAFLDVCGVAAAVSNALPAVKARATLTTEGARGAGVAELTERILADDLRSVDDRAERQRVLLAEPSQDGDPPLSFMPRRDTLLLAGVSGGGKSTLTLGLLERLASGGHQFCVVDPEGDYEDSLPDAIGVGSAEAAPQVGKVMELLRRPGANVIVNLLGVQVEDRPRFFAALLPALQQMRAESSRPHFVVVDEAHHMLPASWDPGAAALSAELEGFLFVTVHPDQLSARALATVDRMLVVGADPSGTASAFCGPRGLPCPPPELHVPPGQVLTFSLGDPAPRLMRIAPGAGARRRHSRKYAEGRLGEDKSFYFRGPGDRLNLRAQNLMMFVQIADGVDAETWEHHRRAGDYSEWLATSIKDEALAGEVAAIETGGSPCDEARAAVRTAIEARYTLPA